MNRNKIQVIKWIFGITLTILCLPFIQQNLKIFKPVPLNGVEDSATKPEFIFSSWFDGNFQKQYEDYYAENIGFRNDLVRLYNQFDYSVFKEVHGENIVLGLNGYLFQQGYIDEITGAKYIGENAMDFKMKKLRIAQDYLNSKGKLFIIVLAPGKASFCKEYIPKRLLTNTADTTNYNKFLLKNKNFGLNVLDFNKWFMQIKDTTSHELFPKQGIHWSYYGMTLAVDSMLHYISAHSDKKLADLSYTLETPEKLRYTDYDLGDLMNLIYKLPYNKMTYPVFSYTDSKDDYHPSILIIGDSYVWTVINSEIVKPVFNDITFYYYNKTEFNKSGATKRDVSSLLMLDEIEKYDIIITLQSEANYNDIGFGFGEKLADEMEGNKSYKHEIYTRLLSDPELTALVDKYSRNNNVDRNKAMSEIADSLYLLKERSLAEIKNGMLNNPEWLNSLKKKAADNNLLLEDVMEKDALWLYEQQHK